jgi:hypothetical protein
MTRHYGRPESSSKSAGRIRSVKACVRKQVQEALAKAPTTPEIEKIHQEYKRKGTLSKREVKILLGAPAPADELQSVA